jgi:hypothetical protein
VDVKRGSIVENEGRFEIGLDYVFWRRQDVGNQVVAEFDAVVNGAADLEMVQGILAGRDQDQQADHS